MSLSLAGQFRASLKMDGLEYDFSSSIFKEARIFESVAEMVPTLQLDLMDDTLRTDVFPFHDGSLLELSLQPFTREFDPVTDDYMPFRLWGSRSAQGNALGDGTRLVGYYDVPALLKDAWFESFSGNTSDIVWQIANKSNLDFDGDPSSDSMRWHSHGQTGANFLKELTRAAWANNTSAYVNAITRTGGLFFYDVSRRVRSDVVWNLIQQDQPVERNTAGPKDVFFREPQVFNYSGLLNRWRGYGVLANYYDALEDADVAINIDTVPKSTDYLNVNKELQYPSRYESLPINCGNVHPNYYRAQVQNQMLLAAYSYNLRVMCPFARDLRLMDRVRVIGINRRTQDVRESMNGDYFIDRIVTIVRSDSVQMVLNLVREGLNSREKITKLL